MALGKMPKYVSRVEFLQFKYVLHPIRLRLGYFEGKNSQKKVIGF